MFSQGDGVAGGGKAVRVEGLGHQVPATDKQEVSRSVDRLHRAQVQRLAVHGAVVRARAKVTSARSPRHRRADLADVRVMPPFRRRDRLESRSAGRIASVDTTDKRPNTYGDGNHQACPTSRQAATGMGSGPWQTGDKVARPIHNRPADSQSAPLASCNRITGSSRYRSLTGPEGVAAQKAIRRGARRKENPVVQRSEAATKPLSACATPTSSGL